MIIRQQNLKLRLALSLAMFLSGSLVSQSHADMAGGLHFLHKDWELACDNSGACRAAGYQTDAQIDRPISILLQRAAGVQSAVAARVKIDPDQLPVKKIIQVTLLGRSYGAVALNERTGEGKLTAVQTQALLQAVQQAEPITWKAEEGSWSVSAAGASAVLLKMDEYQRRLNTASAIVRKGKQPNDGILKVHQLPLIQMKGYSRGIAKRFNMESAQAKRLRVLLQKTATKDNCASLFDANASADDQITVYPLNRKMAVVEAPCWRAAYNEGYGYWVMNSALTEIRQFVTASGSSFSEGQIFSMQKGRGIADCTTQEEWAWNGRLFVRSYKAVQAQCKGFAGGAWEMPLYIARVQTAL